ncbi:MFS transporter [bacterium]|nr:MFS transporter [bacterium]
MRRLLKGIGKNIVLLGIASFFNDVSSEMIIAIFPMFIVSLGGGGMAIGLIGGLGNSLSSILKVFSGYWSDKIGRKKVFVFWGYFSSAIAKLFFPFCYNWGELLFLRMAERIGKGIRTAPRDALLSISADHKVRGKAFGIHRAMDSLGAVMGALGAFFLFWVFEFSFRQIIMVAAVVGFVALFPLFWVEEKKNNGEGSKIKKGLNHLPGEFKKYLIVAALFSLSNFTYMFLILKSKIVMDSFFSPRLAIAVPVLLYVWFNIIYSLFSVPAGIFSDKIGRREALFMGYSIYGITYLGFAKIHSLGLFILFFALYGLAFALIEGNQRAFASDFVEEERRGSALGMFHTVISLTTLFASLIAGYLWNLNSRAPFLYGAGISLFSAMMIFWVKPHRTKKEKGGKKE